MINGSAPPEQRLRDAASSDAVDVLEGYESRVDGHYNEELTTSRIKYGNNRVTERNRHVTLKRLYRAFFNVFILVLAIIDILWMILDPDIIYCVILTSLILVSGTMTFIQETRSGRAAEKLISMVTTIITVRREGLEIEVDSRELVVGDIVILDTGDTVPADVRIIDSNHLKVDQSVLTGETGGVSKRDAPLDDVSAVLSCDNLAFMGTSVVGGSAEAVVVAVGDDTVFGTMTGRLSEKKKATTYDRGSKAVVKVLLKLMAFTIPPVFIIMVAKGYMNAGELLPCDVLEAIVFSLTLAIGLMPEMLATIVSTNLAKGAIDMSKNKVIVKDVNSIQNFGAMDVLCSDKTGTLTQNRISVKACNDVFGKPSHLVELLSCLNSHNLMSATNQIDWAIDEEAEESEIVDERDAYEYVGDVPFDFIRRRATVVVTDGDRDMMITKGAIPEILSISDSYLSSDGEVRPINDEIREVILSEVEKHSVKGMRLLGVTHKYIERGKTEFTDEDEGGQVFAGYLVFTDPVKPSAAGAVKDLSEYGISVKVLTGDNEYVSRYVCDEIGIESDRILVGTDISAMSDTELREAVESADIFSRLTPSDKSRIVIALRENGHTVGLMGDGINDVLAMKNSDVSISVDTGTDIAKEAADMILLEKDLGILKNGAIEGRKVYANSIKYVKMIGSINFGYMFSLIIATMLFNFEPMGAIMILIFNLVNDLACLVTPWDTVEDEFVREPRKWDAVNLKEVMFHYGPLCPLTDILTWTFMVFVVFSTVPGAVGESMMFDVLNREDLRGTPQELLFQSLWCIEQYWMQVWAIHIVRTNKLPFFQTRSAGILVVTTIVALIVGTALPFTGELWGAIASFDGTMIGIPLWSLLWMPFIACIYFAGAHLVKKHMLRKYGYFACRWRMASGDVPGAVLHDGVKKGKRFSRRPETVGDIHSLMDVGSSDL